MVVLLRFRLAQGLRLAHAAPFAQCELSKNFPQPADFKNVALDLCAGFGHVPADLHTAMQRMRSISRFVLLAAVAGVLTGNLFPATVPIPANYRAEAENLQHFAEFAEWPAALDHAASRMTDFCILGQDPFDAAFEESILDHRIGDRAPMIAGGKRLQDLGECDVLFVSASEAKRQTEILEQLRNSQVLTVGETDDFAATGGIIQFVQNTGRVNFVINVDAAGRAGLRIRAELLALAHVVHDSSTKRGG